MSRLAAVLLAAFALLPSPKTAMAQNLEAIVAAESRVVEAWNASPISFRRTIYVTAADGFGVFEERPVGAFKPGEPIKVYAEPVGYAWHDNGDGTFTFGFDIDLVLKKPDGTIVAGKENFQRLALSSHARNREFLLTLTLNLDGAPAGDYVLEYRVRDIASDKAGLISLPLTLSQ